jgi:hypothetical protein
MSRLQQPPGDPFELIADLERRLKILETTGRVGNTSLNDGELIVYDAAGRIRTEVGHLPARGISAEQYGERGWDVNGNLLYDPSRTIIYDGSGNIRVEIGHLPLRGISPDQYGERAWDSSGNLLYDPTTLANMGKSLGISAQGPGQNITSTSYIATTPAITISFTLAYPTRILLAGFVTAKQNTAGKVGYARVNLVGVGATGDMKFGGGATNNSMDVTNAYAHLICAPGSTVTTLPAGNYTARIEAKTDAAGTLYFDQGYIEGWIISPAAF